MPTVVFSRQSGIRTEQLQAAFAEESIDARVFFSPLSSTAMFEPCLDNHIAWDIPTRAINLPSFHDMHDAELARVVAVIKHCLG